MTQQYTVKIKNLYKDNGGRVIIIEHSSAQLAHKAAYMNNLKSDEEIRLITEHSGDVVYDLDKGFYKS